MQLKYKSNREKKLPAQNSFLRFTLGNDFICAEPCACCSIVWHKNAHTHKIAFALPQVEDCFLHLIPLRLTFFAVVAAWQFNNKKTHTCFYESLLLRITLQKWVCGARYVNVNDPKTWKPRKVLPIVDWDSVPCVFTIPPRNIRYNRSLCKCHPKKMQQNG